MKETRTRPIFSDCRIIIIRLILKALSIVNLFKEVNHFNLWNILRLQDENHSGTFEGSEQGLTLLPSDRLVIQKVSQEVDDDDAIHICYDEVCVCWFASFLFIFFSYDWAQCGSRKMDTFSRRSVELGFVKLISYFNPKT